MEPIRDPSHDDFGATFLRPLEDAADGNENEAEDSGDRDRDVFKLYPMRPRWRKQRYGADTTTPFGSFAQFQAKMNGPIKSKAATHAGTPQRVETRFAKSRTVQTDPTRSSQPPSTSSWSAKRSIAFADGRQDAAFFAWYLDHSYRDLLSRSTVLRVAQSFTRFPEEGISLGTVADRALQKS